MVVSKSKRRTEGKKTTKQKSKIPKGGSAPHIFANSEDPNRKLPIEIKLDGLKIEVPNRLLDFVLKKVQEKRKAEGKPIPKTITLSPKNLGERKPKSGALPAPVVESHTFNEVLKNSGGMSEKELIKRRNKRAEKTISKIESRAEKTRRRTLNLHNARVQRHKRKFELDMTKEDGRMKPKINTKGNWKKAKKTIDNIKTNSPKTVKLFKKSKLSKYF
jgi:hypothetical protein